VSRFFLCVLCVSVVDDFQPKTHHRDTEHTEKSIRNALLCKPLIEAWCLSVLTEQSIQLTFARGTFMATKPQRAGIRQDDSLRENDPGSVSSSFDRTNDLATERTSKGCRPRVRSAGEGFRLVQRWARSRGAACAARYRKHFRCFKQEHRFDTTVRSARTRFRHCHFRSEKPTEAVWSRVAGDALDLASLGLPCTAPDAKEAGLRLPQPTCSPSQHST
jgi:hypothetical protein